MAARLTKQIMSLVALLPFVAAAGCAWPLSTTFGPMIRAPWPTPVSPYFQKRHEDQFWVNERYARVPILGPITSGEHPVSLDPPTPDEVMRAMEKTHPVSGNVPLLYEKQRNNVRMTIEPISDYVDPVRVYPLIGPAQQHHAHYKCTVYYKDVTRNGWPLPYTTVDEDAREVLYIDHNHFHMVGNVDSEGVTIP